MTDTIWSRANLVNLMTAVSKSHLDVTEQELFGKIADTMILHISAPAQVVVMPELPAPAVAYADHSYPAYSKRQMQEYGQACALAAQPPAAPVATEGKEWVVPHEDCLNCTCIEKCPGWKELERCSAGTGVEDVARTICLSYGRDPDDMTSILEMCTADNKPVPVWRVYEEQAEAVIAKHLITREPQPTPVLKALARTHSVELDRLSAMQKDGLHTKVDLNWQGGRVNGLAMALAIAAVPDGAVASLSLTRPHGGGK